VHWQVIYSCLIKYSGADVAVDLMEVQSKTITHAATLDIYVARKASMDIMMP
jgi:hypothetical protein